MTVLHERVARLPARAQSPGRARRLLQDVCARAGLDEDLTATVVLLGGELCENAVLHAATEFEVEVRVGPEEVCVTVSDRGPGPLELRLLQRAGHGRGAPHGRGLSLLTRLATGWGTRHDADGTHRTWFCVARADPPAPRAAGGSAPPPTTPPEPAGPVRFPSSLAQVRWLLRPPTGLTDRLSTNELVTELAHRLREALDAHSVLVEVDQADGAGLTELARAGPAPPLDAVTWDFPLPTRAPLRGTLRVQPAPGGDPHPPAHATDLAGLVAQRVGAIVETDWLRGADQRRRAWMSFLAETSELLGQSLDVDLTVAVVPQVVVPRLGQWCAVHLLDSAGLRLAALTHAEEDELPALRAALDGRLPEELRTRLAALLRPAPPDSVRFTVPGEGVGVALRTRGRVIGTLTVGRPATRPHTPEDVVLLGDVARRAALAIHNAQTTAAHVGVSHALQQALLPRALPTAPGVEFAAAYLPATTGSEVGGDFYDVTTIDPAQWLVAIGDVCGTGARAAARTGQVRDMLRVLQRGGGSLVRTVELLNEVMTETGDPLQYCTLAVARVHRSGSTPSSGLEVELVLAGHVQPLLVHHDGGVDPVGEFGTALGLVPRVSVTPTRHRLRPGDTLLLYTDGVTEHRRRGEQFGPERLEATVRTAAGRSATELVGAVRSAVHRWSPTADDDVALLAVRATG